MERCDFSSIIAIIKKYIIDDMGMNQSDIIYSLFQSYYDSSDADVFPDMATVCRWFTGQTKVSLKLSAYYNRWGHVLKLTKDIKDNILPIMYDSSMAEQELYNLLMQDSTVSSQNKRELTKNYPCRKKQHEASFIAGLLMFGMKREFVKRDSKTRKQLTAGTMSPVVRDYIFDGVVPAPCKHFCGRDTELEMLYELLNRNGKVFLRGIPGIGKSELVKAYAKEYRLDYTNIIYLSYSGDLMRDIADMIFVDDLPGETTEERFHKHNRFLRTLKEDTLLIIDNFNTIPVKESLLAAVMKYRCQVLFTTRFRFDEYTTLELEEMRETDDLLRLMGCFYSRAERYADTLEEIIETVHGHTLAVELAARLLEKGILEPVPLLIKLKAERVAMNAEDEIGVSKDGTIHTATYYRHIRTLFSLYKLSEKEKSVMRGMAFMPLEGIYSKQFAAWMQLRNLNDVNRMVDKGFIQTGFGNQIRLHPMIQEVVIADLNPSVRNCKRLLNSLHTTCLIHGEDIPQYVLLAQVIRNVVEFILIDDEVYYLRFLEDCFPTMGQYKCVDVQRVILQQMKDLLQCEGLGNTGDRALVYDYSAALEPNPAKALQYVENGIALIPEITDENALLVANLYSNAGILSHQSGKVKLALDRMETGLKILHDHGLSSGHDAIAQLTNYAAVQGALGNYEKALSSLMSVAQIVRCNNSDKCSDYATISEAIGACYLMQGDITMGQKYLQNALQIYESIYGADSEYVIQKKQEILTVYIHAGRHLAKTIKSMIGQ